MAAPDSHPPRPKTLADHARDWSGPIVDPIVKTLAALHVSPDLLTVLGMLGHFISAYFVFSGQFRLAGLSLLMIAPLDALDGALARRVGTTENRFGAFLDSTFDRLAEIVLFGGFLAYYWSEGSGWLVATTYIAITGSLMVSYARGRAEGLGFNGQVGFFGRLERYVLLIVMLILDQPALCLVLLAVFTYITVVQRMVAVWKQASAE